MKFDHSLFQAVGQLGHETNDGSATNHVGPSRRRLMQSFCACCAGLPIAPAGLALLAAGRAEAATAQGTIRVGHLPAGRVSRLLLGKAGRLSEPTGYRRASTQF